MEHLGIDLGASKSRVCALDEMGEVVLETEVVTTRLAALFKRRPTSRVVFETCTQSSRIAEQAKAAGHEVVVVPGKLVRQLGVGDRGIKTDARDARALAIASRRLPELRGIHLRSPRANELRRLCDTRDRLIGMRTGTVNAVRGHARGRLLNIRTRYSANFCEAMRTLLLADSDGLPVDIALMLDTVSQLSVQISVLDTELERVAESDPICTLLRTMPGVGPITSARFVSTVDTPERFESGARLASYLGLVPGEATTGGKIKRTGLIAAASSRLRATFVQASWSFQHARPDDPLVLWAHSVAERRGKRIATIALARRMSIVLLAMWRSGTNYDCARVRPPMPTT